MKTSEAVSATWEVLTSSAEKAVQLQNYAEAEAMTLAALEEAEEFEPFDHRLAMTLESLSEIYYAQQKYALAAPLCKRLFIMYERHLGPDHLDTGIIAHNAGMLYHSWGKYILAEPYYKKAMKIKTRSLAPVIRKFSHCWDITRHCFIKPDAPPRPRNCGRKPSLSPPGALQGPDVGKPSHRISPCASRPARQTLCSTISPIMGNLVIRP